MEIDEIKKLPALKNIQKARSKIAVLKKELKDSERSIPETLLSLPSQIGYGYSDSDKANFEKIKKELLDQLASLVSDPGKGNEIIRGLSILEESMQTTQYINQAKRDAIIKYLYWHDPEIKLGWLAKAFSIGPREIVEIAGEFQLEAVCEICGDHLTVKSRSDLSYMKNKKICSWCEDDKREERDLQWKKESQQKEKRLLELKTMPYAEYLQTPEWISTRNAKLKSAWYKCQVCNTGKSQLNVHHSNYKNRGAEYSKDLIVLCKECHELFHKNGKLPQEK